MKTWAEGRVDQILEAYGRIRSTRRTAEALKVSRPLVRRVLIAHGIARRKPGRPSYFEL